MCCAVQGHENQDCGGLECSKSSFRRRSAPGRGRVLSGQVVVNRITLLSRQRIVYFVARYEWLVQEHRLKFPLIPCGRSFIKFYGNRTQFSNTWVEMQVKSVRYSKAGKPVLGLRGCHMTHLAFGVVGASQWFHLSPGCEITHRGGQGIQRAKDGPSTSSLSKAPQILISRISPVEGSM